MCGVKSGISVTIISDNLGGYLHRCDYLDFTKECGNIEIKFIRIQGKIHDRFIILDYKEKNFSRDYIEKKENEQIEKEFGLKEKTLAFLK